eukprot:TRINITY_DN408_c0_g1_i1.p1 TRINITY_DN408_c0_g1~~TRINITY_DN408_c0_g1_i1.p1  ORF type:complete len:195 (-),score=53.05 TRINITY_DN408_c0_g1_i1:28-612(-)
MASKIHILLITGSLRKASTNTGLIRAAAKYIDSNLSETVSYEFSDLSQIPLYNEDVQNAGPWPAPVQTLRDQVKKADALLFSVPEYNYSVSGVLKNAIDWVSRTVTNDPSPFTEKPAAIMGAGGRFGTARAQYHFRQIAVFLSLQVLLKPEVQVARYTPGTFDENGDLQDEAIRKSVGDLVDGLVAWRNRLAPK